MKCAKCNKENEADAKFCRYCGASVPVQGPSGQGTLFDVGSPQPAAGNKAAPSNDPRREDVLGWYRYAEIAAVVIVALLITGGVLLAANQVRSRREAASLWAKAWDHSTQGEPDKAATCAQEIMDKYPSTWEAVSARESKPEWDKAYAEQQRQARIAAAEKEKQMRIAALVGEAESLRDKGQLDEAAASIEQALTLDANHSRARGLQVEVQVLIEQRRVQAEKDKKFADLCRSAAGYAGRGDNDKAIDDYTKALEIKPDDAQVIDKLAQCRHDLYLAKAAKAEKDGDLDAAIDHYKTALTHRQTASAQAAMDSAKQALEKRTEEKKRQDFEQLMAAAASADPNKAGEPLSQALKLYPDAPKAVALKKTIIEKLMDCATANDSTANGQKALTALEEILKLDPSNSQALALKNRILAASTSMPSDGGRTSDSRAAVSKDTPIATTANTQNTGGKMAKVSYAAGYFSGTGFKRDSIEISIEDFVQGVKAGVSGTTPTVNEEGMRATLTAFGQELRTHKASSMPDSGGTDAAASRTPMQVSAKVNYAIGYFSGTGFKRDGIEISVEDFLKGIKAGVSGMIPIATEEEMRATLTAFGQEVREKMAEKAKTQSQDNKRKGVEFLAANANKPGVKSMASGLQYKVIVEGSGAMPKASDTVKTHYKGMLIDGTEFDSSYKRGEPIEFPVDGVILGWNKALQVMKVGSKWQLFIPTELAYGENAPPSIGPNQVLIFEVELLDIVRPAGYVEPDTSSASLQPVTTETSRKSDASSPVAPFVGVWGEKWADISARGNIEIKDVDGRPQVTMSGWRVWDEKIESGSLSFRIKGGGSDWEFIYTVTPGSGVMNLDVFRVHDSARYSGQLTK